MPKIVITFNGLVQQEYEINKARITIGRRPSNDIVIDHLTISGQHAAIDTTLHGSFVLDLGSTNGIVVNGQPVKKHLLQEGDSIEVGKYQLRFESAAINGTAMSGTVMSGAAESDKNMNDLISSALEQKGQPFIQVLNGANKGKELMLNKSVTTIGNPASQVIAITKRENAYFVSQVEGVTQSKLNDAVLSAMPAILLEGDLIDLSGVKMMFSYKSGQ